MLLVPTACIEFDLNKEWRNSTLSRLKYNKVMLYIYCLKSIFKGPFSFDKLKATWYCMHCIGTLIAAITNKLQNILPILQLALNIVFKIRKILIYKSDIQNCWPLTKLKTQRTKVFQGDLLRTTPGSGVRIRVQACGRFIVQLFYFSVQRLQH